MNYCSTFSQRFVTIFRLMIPEFTNISFDIHSKNANSNNYNIPLKGLHGKHLIILCNSVSKSRFFLTQIGSETVHFSARSAEIIQNLHANCHQFNEITNCCHNHISTHYYWMIFRWEFRCEWLLHNLKKPLCHPSPI